MPASGSEILSGQMWSANAALQKLSKRIDELEARVEKLEGK